MAEAVADAGGAAEVQANGASSPAVGSTELPSLRSEGERLKLELDNAQLQAELAALNKPWWRKGAIVTTLTAIIAAVLPVTTAVQAHYQKEREIVLQESKQAHEIRTSYLDRMEKPGAQLRTLRFVLATTTDPALKAWAKAEEKRIQSELDEIVHQIKYLQSQESTIDHNRLDQPLGAGPSEVTSTPKATPSKSKITTTITADPRLKARGSGEPGRLKAPRRLTSSSADEHNVSSNHPVATPPSSLDGVGPSGLLRAKGEKTSWLIHELTRLRSKRDETQIRPALCPGNLTKDQELQCLHDAMDDNEMGVGH